LNENKLSLSDLLEWIKQEQLTCDHATNPYAYNPISISYYDGRHDAYQIVMEEIERLIKG
jgi:hypothetical protein